MNRGPGSSHRRMSIGTISSQWAPAKVEMGYKKKIVGACEACEPIQSPPPLIFPRFIRLAGKFACFLRTLA